MQSSYLITNTGATIFHGGQHLVAGNSHKNYARIVDALKAQDFESAVSLLDLRTAARKFVSADPDFTLDGDLVSYKGRAFDMQVSNKVLAMIEAGNSPDSLFNFLRKVRQNPSATSQAELLLFCEANGFMIHEDGDILAYKSVRANYKDIHSGTVLYEVGSTVEIPRGEVDDKRENTCSFGLHFASYKYASTWTRMEDKRMLLIKINPADVVSIPSDYNNQKARTCKLTVAAEIPTGFTLPVKEVYTNRDIDAASRGEEYTFSEDEYTAGYNAGQSDVDAARGFETDFSDKSEDWRVGYEDGYRDNLPF